MSEGLLDSRQKMAELDKSNILSSVEALGDQIEEAWQVVSQLSLNFPLEEINNIVWVGMGGSALGAWLGKYLFKLTLKLPFEIVNHYQLPAYADERSLIILSSYSGNTEEVLAAAKVALERTKYIFVITSGGQLLQLAKENKLPLYLIDPKHNPSNQPRMAIGYAATVLIAFFNRIGLVRVSEDQMKEVVKFLKTRNSILRPEYKDDNLAKLLAYNAFKRLVVFISADHLIGATHVFNNQVNENAKNLTTELVIPEMNHHYLEALSFPKQLRDDLFFLLWDSELFLPRIRRRIELTKQIIDKKDYPHQLVKLEGKDVLTQAFEVIQLGEYTSFYLAMLNGIDPAPIPNVDFLKKNLKDGT